MDILKLLGRLLGAAAEQPVPPRRPGTQRKTTRRKTSTQRKRTTAPASRQRQGRAVTTGQVYGEEPILRTGAQLLMQTPAMIRQMRTLSGMQGQQRSMEALFYRQGKFMEAFTDDFSGHAPCKRTTPMYYNLRDDELRTYFTWRTRYRQGMLPETDSGYLLLYCCELINQIGVRTPEEGYAQLGRVLEDYGESHADIRRYLLKWMNDYAAYYDQPFRCDDERTAANLAMLRHTHQTPENFLLAVDLLSKYHILTSKLYLAYPKETADLVLASYRALLLHYAEAKGASFPAYLLGGQTRAQHIMFEGAVFYEPNRVMSKTVRISPICVYHCYGGTWAVERSCAEPNGERIGAFLRTVDSLLREHLKFKGKIKPGELPEGDSDVIAATIRNYYAELAKKNAPVITLDADELARIRAAAEHTTDMLTLPEDIPEPEPQPEAIPEPAGTTEEASDDMPDLPLSAPAMALLVCLLTGESYQPLIDAGQMISVLTDEINENMYEYFGDTVLETDETGAPVLVEDYIEELKGMLES